MNLPRVSGEVVVSKWPGWNWWLSTRAPEIESSTTDATSLHTGYA